MLSEDSVGSANTARESGGTTLIKIEGVGTLAYTQPRHGTGRLLALTFDAAQTLLNSLDQALGSVLDHIENHVEAMA